MLCPSLVALPGLAEATAAGWLATSTGPTATEDHVSSLWLVTFAIVSERQHVAAEKAKSSEGAPHGRFQHFDVHHVPASCVEAVGHLVDAVTQVSHGSFPDAVTRKKSPAAMELVALLPNQ